MVGIGIGYFFDDGDHVFQEAGDACDDVVKRDLGVLPEADVSVVPAEIIVVVSVVIAQYRAFVRVKELKSIEPRSRIANISTRPPGTARFNSSG